MRKHVVVMLVITILILLTGQGCERKEAEAAESPYIGGTQGVTADFEAMGIVEDNVQTIWEGETFPIEITVKNKGEEDIAEGDLEIALKGILLEDFEGIDTTDGTRDGAIVNSNVLEKMSDVSPEGGEETIDFGDALYTVPVSGSFYDVSVYAEFTYKYATHVAVPKVCFNGDPSDTTVCTVDEEKTSFSSGAPVQVTKVEEKPGGTGVIALLFEVENVGGGEITIPGQNFDPRYGQIAYTVTPSSDVDKWECSSGGRVNEARLIEEKATVRCKLKDALSKDTIYTKQVGLKIEYDYRDLVHEQLRVKKP